MNSIILSTFRLWKNMISMARLFKTPNFNNMKSLETYAVSHRLLNCLCAAIKEFLHVTLN